MELAKVTDKAELAKVLPEVRKILDAGYTYFLKSRWHGPNSDRHLRKTTTEVKFAYDEAGYAACAIYSDSFGGNKLTGITGIPAHPRYNEGVVEIIKDDIKGFDSWYWVEASGAIEHYFKKHGGTPVPSEYAKTFIGRGIAYFEDDGFHYVRALGPEHELCRKCVFGFPSEAEYNKVIDGFADYEDFKERVLKESADDELTMAKNVIGTIEELYTEYEVNEMPPQWAEDLKAAIAVARDYGEEKIALTGELLLDEMPVLKLIKVA